MRVFIVNGSPRARGTIAAVLGAIADRLRPSNDIVELDAYGAAFKPCVGCLRCRPDRACALPRDAGHAFAEELAACDRVLIGSPTYWGSLSSRLMALFERAVPALEYIEGLTVKPRLMGKKAAVVTACAAPFPLYYLPRQAVAAVSQAKAILGAGGIAISASAIFGDSARFDVRGESAIRKIDRIARALG